MIPLTNAEESIQVDGPNDVEIGIGIVPKMEGKHHKMIGSVFGQA